MLKFYINTVIIWFVILIAQGIAFYSSFKKAQEKIKKETSAEEIKKWGYFRTTLWYILISFIPFVRLIVFISKMVMIFDTDKAIEMIKEKENGK